MECTNNIFFKKVFYQCFYYITIKTFTAVGGTTFLKDFSIYILQVMNKISL